jgi:hypothetical protein
MVAPGPSRMLLVAAAGTYIAWIKLFAIYRYLVGIELIAPLLVVAAIDRIGNVQGVKRAAIGAAMIAMIVLVLPGNWGRASWPLSADYFNVPVPPIDQPAASMVIMAGWQPAAYVIPKFPPELRFIRIQGNFTSPDDVENRHNALMRDIVAAHPGPLYLLFTDHEYADVIQALSVYRLEIVWPPCREMPSSLDGRLVFCPLKRSASTSPR